MVICSGLLGLEELTPEPLRPPRMMFTILTSLNTFLHPMTAE
jgi:hypothetical protein